MNELDKAIYKEEKEAGLYDWVNGEWYPYFDNDFFKHADRIKDKKVHLDIHTKGKKVYEI